MGGGGYRLVKADGHGGEWPAVVPVVLGGACPARLRAGAGPVPGGCRPVAGPARSARPDPPDCLVGRLFKR